MSEFDLYPEEQHWWSFNDYRAVLQVVRQVRPARVLEFGPGSSTLALVEGGALWVDTCEDDPEWAAIYEDRIVSRFPGVVHLRRYEWSDPLSVPSVDEARYDLAMIDGPRDTTRRPFVLEYALARCTRVLLPLEEADGREGYLRPRVLRAAADAGRPLRIFEETGPLAGAFALIGPPAC